MQSKGLLLLALFSLGVAQPLALASCGGGVRPYRAMAKAAASNESVEAQARDKRLSLEVRQALEQVDAAAVIHISPHVYMDRVFLVGFVNNAEQRSQLETAARGVEGVRDVDGYLPVRSDSQGSTTATVDDAELKAELSAALAADLRTTKLRVDTEVVAGHVVLLGVVSSDSERDAVVQVADGIVSPDRVTSFLLLPDPEYEKRLRSLLHG